MKEETFKKAKEIKEAITKETRILDDLKRVRDIECKNSEGRAVFTVKLESDNPLAGEGQDFMSNCIAIQKEKIEALNEEFANLQDSE